ncbi:class II aldolase/adducin family protein [Capillimicrobium parvum]|uniref:L-fuculose phosphate aldolase n=1 Tax=Capillimicrobium parvum TaxID=2884022 RepID=A0A9E7C0K4_9ACTN|nr:class II aldolase/adducin family protein [Capillimicrobium parvum]UGS36525.1 L-fuculose phosphate aldolase [Capillimicrobium parvum]
MQVVQCHMIGQRRRGTEREVIRVARELSRRDLVVGSVGNVSVRDGDHVCITPTRMPYDALRRRDTVIVTLTGDKIAGRRPASRELPIHLAAYRARPDARAIVHTHSTYATVLSILGTALPRMLEEQDYYGIGEIPVVSAAAPGSRALADGVAAAATRNDAMLLARHGVLTLGADADTALARAEVVERTATAAWLLRAVGSSPMDRLDDRHRPAIKAVRGTR